MINVDTEQLLNLMSVLETANQQINEAMEMLYQTTVHNDWSCKERHTINEYVLDCRKECKALQEKSDRLVNAARRSANGFIETESGISNMFSSVDALLGKFMEIVTTSNIVAIRPPIIGNGVGGKETANGVSSIVGKINPGTVWDILPWTSGSGDMGIDTVIKNALNVYEPIRIFRMDEIEL